jgi:hypothetical protein
MELEILVYYWLDLSGIIDDISVSKNNTLFIINKITNSK